MEGKQGYRFPGDIEVKRLALVSQSGQVIDIGPITLEVSVFQDLHKHYLRCEIVLSDALALINSLGGDSSLGVQGGFNGGEVLLLSYKSRDSEIEEVNHFFALYELAERQRVDEKVETYVISGISAEAYQSATKKISRAYGGTGGNLISKMVESVVNEYVYNRIIKDTHRNYREVTGFRLVKDVNIDPTNGLQRLVIPNMTVDDTLDFFASEADCDNHIPYYIFYEDSNGFNFKDMNSLVAQEPKATFTYVQANVEDDKSHNSTEIKGHEKIVHYEVKKQVNMMGNATGGLFRSKTINLDILSKNKREVVFDYANEWQKFSKLQQHRIPGAVEGDAVVNLVTSRIGHDSSPIFQSEIPLPKRINQFGARRQSFRKHISNVMMAVTINGDSELNVGDVIYLKIPQSTTLDKSDGQEDKYLSGKYLITKLRHKFGGKTGEQFMTFIECIKDTGIEI
jgi:hypothetical protein